MKARRNAISVVGLGYVGLSTSVCLASRGFLVYGVDLDERKLRLIESGRIPFHEDGLEPLLKSAIRRRSLICTSHHREAVQKSELTFVSVGTPSKPSEEMNLSYVQTAAEEIGEGLRHKSTYHTVVIKSTVVPGTTEGIVKPALEGASGRRCGVDFGLCFNPEFLREGTAVKDTLDPDAIVVGAVDDRSSKAVIDLWGTFYGRNPRRIVTTPANAELIKLAVNSFRATQLSFLNTLANLSSRVPGSDVHEVVRGLGAMTNLDERYQGAGLGFGGSCLPKDLKALIAFAEAKGVDARLLRSTLEVNDLQPQEAIKMARGLVGELRGRKVALLGLAYKPNTDDVRDSVAIELTRRLVEEGARVTVYDPKAMNNARLILNGVSYAKSARDCLAQAECGIVATGWREFLELKPKDFKSLMMKPVVIDGRRIYDPVEFEREGVRYLRIGSPA